MSTPEIRPFAPSDIEFALRVGAEAGWNQLAADWARMLNYAPYGCFLATLDDAPAGTVTTTSYGTELAWIGMMLVDPRWRRRGVARRLMEHCIAHLRSTGVQSIKLDATPNGRLVYQQLGFQDEWEFQRWQRPAATPHSSAQGSLPTTDSSPPLAHVCQSLCFDSRRYAELDQQAFGATRGAWLTQLATHSTTVCTEHAFGMRRSGRLADYLGPIVAPHATAAEHILQRLLADQQRDLFWDVPGDNPAAVELARRLGFTPVRTLVRMWLQQPLAATRPDYLWGLADPACG